MERKSFYILNFGFTFSTLNYKFLVLLCSYVLVLFFRTKEFVRKIHLFMQNKPNFLDDQISVTSFITTNYEQRTMNYDIKNKPKTNPISKEKNAHKGQNPAAYLLWHSRPKTASYHQTISLTTVRLPGFHR
jgi:hypothetical protein